jgi:predicted peroxiredoxin
METPERKKLIFFVSADPHDNPGPAWSAYHFAKVAAEAGLDAEVRLAGDGVRVAHLDSLQGSERAVELREKAKAGAKGSFLVSL